MTKMTMLNILAVKSIIRSQSFSVFSCFSLGVTFPKLGAFNYALSSVQQTPKCSQFRFYCYNHEKKYDDHTIVSKNSKSEEQEWLKRISKVAMALRCYHQYLNEASLDFDDSLSEDGTKFLSMEKEKLAYRERWAIYRLINKIEDVAKRLIDDNVNNKCRIFYIPERYNKQMLDKVLDEAKYDECWMSLLTSSKRPLAEKLNEKLKAAGIPPQTFSLSMKKVHRELDKKYLDLFEIWSLEVVDFGPEDIISVLSKLSLNDTDYECIKILFNIEESENWKLQGSYKRKGDIS